MQEDEDQQDLPLHGYAYMKWPFGANRTLITRGQVHSFENLNQSSTDEDDPSGIKYNNIYAVNQWKLAKDAWENIDADKAAILSLELTNNTKRMARWALQSMLAGAENMKLVFVNRQKLSNNKKHAILGTQTISTKNFFDLISFKFDEAWSNVKYIADYFENKEDGEYLILRDSIKSSLKIYRMEDGDGEGDDEFGEAREAQ